MMNAKLIFSKDEYPSLFFSSDAASKRSQKIHLMLQQSYLVSLVLVSLSDVLIFFENPSITRWAYRLSAIFLGIGLFVLSIIRAQQYDKAWFNSRAIAESIKTLTWRYMMRIPPFQEDQAAQNRLFSELQNILKARPGIEKTLALTCRPNSAEITASMKHIRDLSLEERKEIYLLQRLRDQKAWYADKAKYNAQSASRLFWMVVVFQFIALIAAIILPALAASKINLVLILTTVVAALAAWNQTKRYDELAQAYSFAAQELSALDGLSFSVSSEESFEQLIEQTESAISREHIMWYARREVHLGVPNA